MMKKEIKTIIKTKKIIKNKHILILFFFIFNNFSFVFAQSNINLQIDYIEIDNKKVYEKNIILNKSLKIEFCDSLGYKVDLYSDYKLVKYKKLKFIIKTCNDSNFNSYGQCIKINSKKYKSKLTVVHSFYSSGFFSIHSKKEMLVISVYCQYFWK